MKAFKFLSIITLLFLLSAATSCGGDSDPVSDTYIPDLSAAPGWVNVADDTDFIFFFNTPPAGTASGTFDGNRNGTGYSYSFTGSFDHSDIQLTFTSGINDGRLFSGKINGSASPVVFTITSPASGANAAITLTYKR